MKALIYKDTDIVVEARGDMIRIETSHTPNCGDDSDGAWLPLDEALFMAKGVVAAIKQIKATA